MSDAALHFGEIDTVLLLGGGAVLSRLAVRLRRRGLRTVVFTAPRHLSARLPDRGRPMGEFLEAEGIPFVSCERIDEEPSVRNYEGRGTLALSLGAPWIFTRGFIDRFRGRLLNVHGAPLPEHRGAGGYTWRILMDDRRGASLIHVVDEGLDTGPIVKVRRYQFPEECRIPADFERVQHERDVAFLEEFFEEVKAGRTFHPEPQDDAKSTYFPRLYTRKHGAIDWSLGACDLDRFVRAFDRPYPGAFTRLRDDRVVLRDARFHSEEGPFHPFQAGLIYRVFGGRAFIAARAGGALSVGRILDSDGRNVVAERLIGRRLTTPGSWLEDARLFRAVYDPHGVRV